MEASHLHLLRTTTLLILIPLGAGAQPEGFNYDEAKVPEYALPDPLVRANGKPVSDAAAWYTERRPEILELFETHVYGRAPEPPDQMGFEIVSIDKQALGGKAVRKQITIQFSGDKEGPKMDLLLYLPADADRPVPAFLGLNFQGNHSIHSDPGIKLSTSWMRDRPEQGVVGHRATEASRGGAADRWPVEMILARGYALATIYYGDIDPDYDDGFQNGVHPLFYKDGQSKPGPGEWGSIAAWAWGLSRTMDYFEHDDSIDERHVTVLGHSRLGKTSLWAGAHLAVGRRAGHTLRPGDLKQFRLRGRRAQPTSLRGDRQAHQYLVPALVCRQLQPFQRQRRCLAGGSAHVDRPHRSQARLRRQRGRGRLGRPARGVPLGETRRARL